MSSKLSKEDYYINDKGLMVFTEAYHLKRGVCCDNKCTHCPYKYKNVEKDNNKGLLP